MVTRTVRPSATIRGVHPSGKTDGTRNARVRTSHNRPHRAIRAKRESRPERTVRSEATSREPHDVRTGWRDGLSWSDGVFPSHELGTAQHCSHTPPQPTAVSKPEVCEPRRTSEASPSVSWRAKRAKARSANGRECSGVLARERRDRSKARKRTEGSLAVSS
jgi:hypothetical protein